MSRTEYLTARRERRRIIAALMIAAALLAAFEAYSNELNKLFGEQIAEGIYILFFVPFPNSLMFYLEFGWYRWIPGARDLPEGLGNLLILPVSAATGWVLSALLQRFNRTAIILLYVVLSCTAAWLSAINMWPTLFDYWFSPRAA